MPAMLDDPTSPAIYRRSGEAPFPEPRSALPTDVEPRQVTLRDRVTKTTIIPFSSLDDVPLSLLAYLCDQLNKEIEKGDTYPMTDAMSLAFFGPYWFANFAAVMLLGSYENVQEVKRAAMEGKDWDKECLGSFYIKPNYPGRSSHVCNGGFLVTDGARNRGVGRLMGERYLEWAPKLGYRYSVFNLVYETNVASCRIWDALGFKRIGRVKGCGNLKSYPNEFIDAIIYGRDLGPEGEDYISEERFERIKFYLKHSRYPDGADRAEKSRLRSAASHYKLVPATGSEPEKLMLKGKEVVSDPQRQYDVARRVHIETHGGINKTTAAVAEKYHWIRIKETASQVIKNCPTCVAASASSIRVGNLPPQRQQPPLRQGPSGTWTQGHFYPFDREYSVPPGDSWLGHHGQLADEVGVDQCPQTPIAPPPDMPELQNMKENDENDTVQNPDLTMDDIGLEYVLGGGDVPVDPALMDGLEQTQLFLDAETQAEASNQLAAEAPGRSMKAPRRPARSGRGATIFSEASSVGQPAAQQAHVDVQGGSQGEGTNEFRRVTRRLTKGKDV